MTMNEDTRYYKERSVGCLHCPSQHYIPLVFTFLHILPTHHYFITQYDVGV